MSAEIMRDAGQPDAAEAVPPVDPRDDRLTPLEPAYADAVRIALAISCAVPVIGAGALDFLLLRTWTGGVPLLLITALLVSALLIWRVPGRRLASWGYALGADQLRVAHGFMWHIDTIVPFVRVQHIDVGRGPVERMLGLATLTVHTAGNYNSTVSLPGLSPATAEAMRDRIRAEIRSDFG